MHNQENTKRKADADDKTSKRRATGNTAPESLSIDDAKLFFYHAENPESPAYPETKTHKYWRAISKRIRDNIYGISPLNENLPRGKNSEEIKALIKKYPVKSEDIESFLQKFQNYPPPSSNAPPSTFAPTIAIPSTPQYLDSQTRSSHTPHIPTGFIQVGQRAKDKEKEPASLSGMQGREEALTLLQKHFPDCTDAYVTKQHPDIQDVGSSRIPSNTRLLALYSGNDPLSQNLNPVHLSESQVAKLGVSLDAFNALPVHQHRETGGLAPAGEDHARDEIPQADRLRFRQIMKNFNDKIVLYIHDRRHNHFFSLDTIAGELGMTWNEVNICDRKYYRKNPTIHGLDDNIIKDIFFHVKESNNNNVTSLRDTDAFRELKNHLTREERDSETTDVGILSSRSYGDEPDVVLPDPSFAQSNLPASTSASATTISSASQNQASPQGSSQTPGVSEGFVQQGRYEKDTDEERGPDITSYAQQGTYIKPKDRPQDHRPGR